MKNYKQRLLAAISGKPYRVEVQKDDEEEFYILHYKDIKREFYPSFEYADNYNTLLETNIAHYNDLVECQYEVLPRMQAMLEHHKIPELSIRYEDRAFALSLEGIEVDILSQPEAEKQLLNRISRYRSFLETRNEILRQPIKVQRRDKIFSLCQDDYCLCQEEKRKFYTCIDTQFEKIKPALEIGSGNNWYTANCIVIDVKKMQGEVRLITENWRTSSPPDGWGERETNFGSNRLLFSFPIVIVE